MRSLEFSGHSVDEAIFIGLNEMGETIDEVEIETIQSVIEEERYRKGFLITDHLFKRIQESCNRVYLLANGRTHTVEHEDDLKRLGYISFE